MAVIQEPVQDPLPAQGEELERRLNEVLKKIKAKNRQGETEKDKAVRKGIRDETELLIEDLRRLIANSTTSVCLVSGEGYERPAHHHIMLLRGEFTPDAHLELWGPAGVRKLCLYFSTVMRFDVK